MAKTKEYTTKKYDGDDAYSWAIFRSSTVCGIRGTIFYGQAQPICSGMSRSEASYHCRLLNDKSAPKVIAS